MVELPRPQTGRPRRRAATLAQHIDDPPEIPRRLRVVPLPESPESPRAEAIAAPAGERADELAVPATERADELAVPASERADELAVPATERADVLAVPAAERAEPATTSMMPATAANTTECSWNTYTGAFSNDASDACHG
jgi:hypothetical protein